MSKFKKKSPQEKADEQIERLKAKINAAASQIKGFDNAFVYNCTDAPEAYLISIGKDGSVEKIEKGPAEDLKEKGIATISSTIDDFKAQLDGQLAPIAGIQAGVIRVDGSMDVLMKLAPALM